MAKHSYEEIANDFSLWGEYVDTGAEMSADEFYGMSVESKVSLMVDAFGAE